MKSVFWIFAFLLLSGMVFFLARPIFAQENCRPYGKCGIPFYPQNSTALKNSLEQCFKDAEKVDIPKEMGNIVALISPHAGYSYAGKIMATGFQLLKDKPIKRVFIIGFSHRYPVSGIDVGDWDYVSTPLGKIPVDKDVVKELLKNKPFVSKSKNAQDTEWSTENQIPFLQSVLKNFKIVILLVGEMSEKEREESANLLKKYISPDSIFVISSDFTHYGPQHGYVPFKENFKENLYKLDGGAIDLIVKRDYQEYMKYLDRTQATICGREAIALLVKIIEKEAIEGKKLAYMTSGDIEGDYEMNSVGYASIGFFEKGKKATPQASKSEIQTEPQKEQTKPEESKSNKKGDTKMKEGVDSDKKKFRESIFGPENEPEPPKLSDEEKKTLIQISREMLDNATKKRDYHPDFSKYNITPNLKVPCRVFVTLKMKDSGELRGCIGFSQAELSLAEAVVKSTYNSCFEDPRFTPVLPEEIKNIHIEISVNSPPRLASGYKDIELGKHGIYLVKWIGNYPRVATFLPVVAIEQHWDIEQTLSHLSRKAGLPSDAWKDKDTEFYLYTSQVIEE